MKSHPCRAMFFGVEIPPAPSFPCLLCMSQSMIAGMSRNTHNTIPDTQ